MGMGLVNQLIVERNTEHFSTEGLDKLRENMAVRSFDEGSKIYWEGDNSEEIYYLMQGKVKLTKLNEDGKELTMYHYFSGDLFGEYPSMNSQMCSFTAQTTEESIIGVIQQRDVDELVREFGYLALELTQWMSQMQRYTQMKLRDLLLYGKNGALASTLIRISNTYGSEERNKINITRKFTNIELAKLIGATRETVNRLLADFKQNGLISYEQGRIEILNMDGLKSINQCEGCPAEICRL
ncbi:Crp/Fnr family transcriptional regulator [Virgibacillus ainsalahensis]